MEGRFRNSITIAWLVIYLCQGQTTFTKIDSLFSFCNESTPGYAIGIIQDGHLIYSNGYGSANLEYQMPLTDTSSFYIASLAKQFTAACIMYLVDQGKISLQDDVRRYIPEMPRHSTSITLDHLLHHTSGVREWSSLVLFQGLNPSFEDHLDNKTLLRLICKQNELNFEPGTAYKYSSSGYILLAEIIERVSGMPLRDFAEKVLFKPLDMQHTIFEDNHSEVIRNRVESYRKTGKGYERLLKGFDVYGDGGVLTTVKDLAKWDRAFYSDTIFKDFSFKMYQLGRVNNREIDYAAGLIRGENQGLTYYQHQGGMIQFDSYMIRYPEQHFSVVVLSNSWSNPYSGYIAGKISELFLSDQFSEVEPKVNLKSIEVDPNYLKSYEGYYWNLDDNYYNRISFRNDSLFYDNTEGFFEYLVPIDTNVFQMANYDCQISFQEDGSIMYYSDSSLNNPTMTFEKYLPGTPESISELEDYLGDYFSEELQTWYHFYISDGVFHLKINNNKPMELWPNPVPGARWNSPSKVWIGFAVISFLDRNTLSLGDTRVRQLDLHKIIPTAK